MSSNLSETVYQKYAELIKDQRLPALILDRDKLNQNISDIAKRSDHLKVRIASKSVRCLPLLKYVLESSSKYQGILCFSAEEAVFLSQNGLDDLVVAYPTSQTEALDALAEEVKKGKKIYPMVDCAEHMRILKQTAKKHGITISYCLEIDMSMKIPAIHFGVMRSPIRKLKDVEEILKEDALHSEVQLKGVMGYEAQIAGLGDYNPAFGIKSPIIRLLKKRSIPKIKKFRTAVIELIKSRGITLDFINGGGTGSFESTKLDPSVTEIAMGSGLFAPTLFDYYKNFQHQPSLFYALEVCRIPEAGIVTCLGGGYVASGSIGVDKVPRPFLPEGLKLTENEGVGEVQTPIETSRSFKIGDPIFFRHSKAGEICERFNKIIVIEDNKICDTWPTYRGEGACFF